MYQYAAFGYKTYLLKRYSPSDSFCTFFFWECKTNLCARSCEFTHCFSFRSYCHGAV